MNRIKQPRFVSNLTFEMILRIERTLATGVDSKLVK